MHFSRILLIVGFISVLLFIIENDARPAGRGRAKGFRGRIRNPFKNQLKRPISLPRKSASGAGVLVGTWALHSYVQRHRATHLTLQNGTGDVCSNTQNFSSFAFNDFRCPLSPIFAPSDRYCCGPIGQQYCCSFWESGRRAIGAIVAIISACCLFLLLIVCCIVHYRRYLRRKGLNDAQQPVHQSLTTKSRVTSIPKDSPPSYAEAMRHLRPSHV